MILIRFLRKTLRLGLLVGIGYGIWKTLQSRRAHDSSWESDSWVTTGAPGATVPAPAPAPAPAAPPGPAPDGGEAASARQPASRPQKPGAGTGPGRKGPGSKAEAPPGERLWVAANDGVCPPTHPVKAKLSSKIFHSPGGRNYSRTRADRCYPDEASAQADGLRPAMR